MWLSCVGSQEKEDMKRLFVCVNLVQNTTWLK